MLLARYVHAIDGRNRAEFAACFAVDALVDYGPPGSWSGREHVVDGLLGLVDHLDATQHVITNAWVDDIDDAGIKVRSNLIAPHLLASVVKR